MEEKKKIRITIPTIVFMGAVAFFYDFLQGLTTAGVIGLILSTFISIWAWFHFYLWYKIKGVNYFEGKLGKAAAKQVIRKFGPMIIAFLFELAPALNVFPAITIGVVITATLVHLEDKAVQKGILSEEDLKEFQKYLMNNKRILVGNFNQEDLTLLYRYGEKRVAEKLKDSPKMEKMAHIANIVSRDIRTTHTGETTAYRAGAVRPRMDVLIPEDPSQALEEAA